MKLKGVALLASWSRVPRNFFDVVTPKFREHAYQLERTHSDHEGRKGHHDHLASPTFPVFFAPFAGNSRAGIYLAL